MGCAALHPSYRYCWRFIGAYVVTKCLILAAICNYNKRMIAWDDGEQRLQSLGWFHDRVVFLVWTERNDGPQVISCRYGDKHETRTYFKALGLHL